MLRNDQWPMMKFEKPFEGKTTMYVCMYVHVCIYCPCNCLHSAKILAIPISIIFGVPQFALFFAVLSSSHFTPSVTIAGAEPLKFALHFGAWFIYHSCFACAWLLVSCLRQTWQTLLSTSTSRHLPVSIHSHSMMNDPFSARFYHKKPQSLKTHCYLPVQFKIGISNWASSSLIRQQLWLLWAKHCYAHCVPLLLLEVVCSWFRRISVLADTSPCPIVLIP